MFKNTKSRALKDKTIFDAHVKYGYTLKQIGECLGIHYSTVSKVVSKRETRKNRYFKT